MGQGGAGRRGAVNTRGAGVSGWHGGREGTLEASVGSWDEGVAAARERDDSL